MSKHLKRLAAPRAVRLHRKEKTWTIKSSPGPHPLEKSIPLGLIIRDYLGLCDTYREAKKAISSGDVLVDSVKRKNHKFPCGFMDVISIPKLKKNYRVLFDRKGKLTLVPISVKDAEWKLYRIENKTIIKGNKIQLNFHDGRNKLVKKDVNWLELEKSKVLSEKGKNKQIYSKFVKYISEEEKKEEKSQVVEEDSSKVNVVFSYQEESKKRDAKNKKRREARDWRLRAEKVGVERPERGRQTPLQRKKWQEKVTNREKALNIKPK